MEKNMKKNADRYSQIYTCTYSLYTYIYIQASQVELVVKNLHANAGDIRDMGSISGMGRFPEEGHGNPLQYPCLENLIDREAWQATVQGAAKNWA